MNLWNWCKLNSVYYFIGNQSVRVRKISFTINKCLYFHWRRSYFLYHRMAKYLKKNKIKSFSTFSRRVVSGYKMSRPVCVAKKRIQYRYIIQVSIDTWHAVDINRGRRTCYNHEHNHQQTQIHFSSLRRQRSVVFGNVPFSKPAGWHTTWKHF